MKWLDEYKQSLKNLHAEEPLDVYFFRPIAFLIVKALYALPLTPNQYSFMALLSGIAAGYFFIQGTTQGYQIGALFFLAFAVLDCCDGMVARLKKNGTEFGRLVDGVVDYIVNAIVYITLSLSFLRKYPNDFIQPWVMIIIAAVSKAIQAISYDHYLTEYMAYEKGDGGFVLKEIEELNLKLAEEEKKKGFSLRKLALKLYLGYSSIQAGNQGRPLLFNPGLYCEKNLRALRLWSLIGPSVHMAVFIISCLINEPYLLICYSVIFANLWLAYMFYVQFKINQELSVLSIKEKAL